MSNYRPDGPDRAEIDTMRGPVVVEFGTDWCGHCQAAQPAIAEALAAFPTVAHVKIEDGRGRPVGRSFGVKLWPTLIFLSDGREATRVVRPRDARTVQRALAELAATDRREG